jgi:hypothetical protein
VGTRNERHWIEQQLQDPHEGKTVAVTYHGPYPLCQHIAFPVSEMSTAFHSDLSSIIEQYDIDIWAYGHTHDNLDTVVYDTRIVSNRAGYPGENVKGFDVGLCIEL